jgi:DNA-binding transcriptional ArsR family regulator
MESITHLSSEINQLHADICSALADPTRILMLYLLAEHPNTVNELTLKLGVAQPTTSRHLKILRDRGLVQASRLGQTVEYSLVDTRLIDSLDLLRAVLRDSISYRASLMSGE